MNQTLKLALTAGMAAMVFFVAGCGDAKNPEAKSAAKPAQTTQATKPADGGQFANLLVSAKKPTPENKNPNAPKPTSPLYVYKNGVKDASDINPFTPEITAAFEKEAKHFQLGEGKKWVYSVNVSKSTNVTPPKTYTQMWIGALPGHHGATFKVNDKTQIEEHLGYITIKVDRATKKIVSIDSKRIDSDASNNGKGKTTQFTKWYAK